MPISCLRCTDPKLLPWSWIVTWQHILHFQLGVWQRPLSMCCYTQFLTRTSTWDILSFIVHIRRCSLLQDFNIWFHRVQTFFPNDTEPPPHSTSGRTHMKTDSCSNSPCFYPSPEFYSAPLQSLSLHCLQPFVCLFPPSFISRWPASFWAPQAAPLLMVAAYSLCAASVTSGWSELHWSFISFRIAAALSCHQHLLIQLVFSYNLTCNLFI